MTYAIDRGIPRRLVLGSTSPRRHELLSGLLGTARFDVVPPRSPEEPDFVGLTTLALIDARLHEIARLKHHDVVSQLAERGESAVVLTADTTIVGIGSGERCEVCGKPPDDPAAAAATVRRWFRELYAGRAHLAKTAVCVGAVGEPVLERLVTSEVWFRSDAERYVDWYLGTGEPFGKAGGYALQGVGSLFVERVIGSLSNVVGLPLAETWEMLERAAVCAKPVNGSIC